MAENTLFSPDGRRSGTNGYEIHIALDAKDPAMVVFKHEVTHYLQKQNARGYQAFQEIAGQAQAGSGAMETSYSGKEDGTSGRETQGR